MPQYAPYLREEFQERRQAEAWAKKKKTELQSAGLGTSKIDIDFDNKSGTWIARLLVPIT